MPKSATPKEQRQRVFATIVYPESAPADWTERLNDKHIQVLISPLHDRDTLPDGTPKKPHYHVLVIFESPKDFEKQVKPIFEEIGGVGREKIASTRGYARYLCHLDNPEKAQYSPADVTALGGAVYSEITRSAADENRAVADMMAYIRDNEIYSLAEFIDICRGFHEDWFSLLVTSKAYIIDKYIKALTWESDTGYTRACARKVEPDVDPETGEILD